MTKQNLTMRVAVAAALGLAAAGAQAGNMATTTRTFATENFGPTQAATVAVTPAAISYSISGPGGVTVATGQTITLYLRLSGTHVFAAAPTTGQFSTLNIGAAAAATAPTSVSWTAGATAGTVSVTYTSANAASTNLPVNTSIIYTPAAGAVSAASASLSTAGSVMSITGSLDGGVANNASVTLPASQDPISAPVNIAVSAAAVTGAAFSSAAFPAFVPVLAVAGVIETKRIDLGAATGVATAFLAASTTNTGTANLVNLGGFVYNNNATVTPTTLTGTAYALATLSAVAGAVFTNTTATITPGSGEAFPLGSSFHLALTAACAASGIASAAVTAGTTTTPVTVSPLVAVPGSGIPQFVCLTVPAAAPFATMTPLAATLTSALTKTVATDASNTASGSLFPLVYNGQTYDVRSYIPAAEHNGYTSFVRVINTGGLTADVKAAVIDPTTGVIGSAFTIISALPARAAKTMTSTEIEAIIGAIPSGTRPRIRITAPTTGMNVQSFFLQPGGAFTDANGAQ